MPLMTIEDLRVDRGGRAALTDVELAVDGGTTVAVIGPNGSGKTTLLRAIAGLDAPVRGRIEVDRSQVAIVLQATEVDRTLPITVRDTVTMGRYPRRGLLGRFRADDRAAVDDALERLDIADLADRQLHELSGGQRQRVLVAQGLAQDGAVLLLDEPITGLDAPARSAILDAIAAERAAGHVVVLATHDLADARRCDHVVLLAGRMVASGPPDEVLVEAHLRAAYGGRVLRVGDDLLVDDPHHGHVHA